MYDIKCSLDLVAVLSHIQAGFEKRRVKDNRLFTKNTVVSRDGRPAEKLVAPPGKNFQSAGRDGGAKLYCARM